MKNTTRIITGGTSFGSRVDYIVARIEGKIQVENLHNGKKGFVEGTLNEVIEEITAPLHWFECH